MSDEWWMIGDWWWVMSDWWWVMGYEWRAMVMSNDWWVISHDEWRVKGERWCLTSNDVMGNMWSEVWIGILHEWWVISGGRRTIDDKFMGDERGVITMSDGWRVGVMGDEKWVTHDQRWAIKHMFGQASYQDNAWRVMGDEWLMMGDEWRMKGDAWTTMSDGWWVLSEECRVTSYEWWGGGVQVRTSTDCYGKFVQKNRKYAECITHNSVLTVCWYALGTFLYVEFLQTISKWFCHRCRQTEPTWGDSQNKREKHCQQNPSHVPGSLKRD